MLETADAARLAKEEKLLYGDRAFRALLLPMPSVLFREQPALRDAANEWMAHQLDAAPEDVGTVYVMPGDSVEKIEAMLTHRSLRGFKCYHQTAQKDGSTLDANIGEYLPESTWQVADRRGMSITLHMVKDCALADEVNLSYIRRMTGNPPEIQRYIRGRFPTEQNLLLHQPFNI